MFAYFIDTSGSTGVLVASVLIKSSLLRGGVLERPEVIAQARVNFHSVDGPFADVAANVPSSHLVV